MFITLLAGFALSANLNRAGLSSGDRRRMQCHGGGESRAGARRNRPARTILTRRRSSSSLLLIGVMAP